MALLFAICLSKLVRTIGLVLIIYVPAFSQHLELVPPVGHIGSINSIQFSKDNKLIVSAGQDGTVKIWDVASGRLIHDLTDHISPVTVAHISPDGKRIVSISIDGAINIWNTASGKLLHDLTLHNAFVYLAHFSFDGKKIVSSGMDLNIKVWDVESGILLHDFFGDGDMDPGLALVGDFSPDGKMIIAWNWKTVNIWDVASGKLLHTLTDQTDGVSSAHFSPDNKMIISTKYDGTHKLWDLVTGKSLHDLTGHTDQVRSTNFSPDSKMIISASDDGTCKIWDVGSGKLLHDLIGHTDRVNSAHFSPDGKMIVSASADKTIKIWDVASGELLYDLLGHTNRVNSAHFSPDGKMIVSRDGGSIKIWNVASGKLFHDLTGHTELLLSALFVPNSKTIAVRTNDGRVIFWDGVSRKPLHSIKIYTDSDQKTGRFSPDGNMLVTWDRNVKIWDVTSGSLLHDLTGHTRYVFLAQFSPDSKLIVSASADKTIKIWDVASGKLIHNLEGHTDRVQSAYFSPDGKMILSSGWDKTVKIWDVSSGRLIHDLTSESGQFSPDSKMFVTWNSLAINIWDVTSGKLLHTFMGHTSFLKSVNFSPDSKMIVSAGDDKTVKIWNLVSDSLLHNLIGHSGRMETARFSPDSKMIISVSSVRALLSFKFWEVTSGNLIRQFEIKRSFFQRFNFEELNFEQDLLLSYKNSALSFHRISDGKELFSFMPIDSLDWVAIDPEGRFDATQYAMNLMHFVLGDEIIEFQQLKDRFYEPGLVEKILGRLKEPLRKSRGINNILLHPTIDLTHPSENKGKLGIKLTNRGGGIGKVVVWINGKEVETDVRGKKIKTNVEELEINYTIQDHPYIKPGELNIIEVKAYNKEEYLVSQGKKIYFLADGIKKEPGLYALVAGSSNYSGDALDLNYAAKDAEDFANALGLVGNKFFGEDKVDIRLLTTEQEEFINWPTKENIERNFKEISTTASPFDVFVVYLSGHGTSYGGSEGDFYYLTSDAASGTLTDPVVREQVAISSEEFIEYFKWVPALKQVMILDACHSGQLAEDLLAKRESRSSAEIRALERMKDRTGMYVLAGSAADAVSYETSIYGQGLLTYSLLLGMKGASLRENKFVDVMQLFQFAADKVPELAKDIGGIQKPEVRVPYGGQSFDIGMVNEEIQNKIKLPSPKPLFLRSSFSDENSFDDHLRLSELLDELFADQQANGGRSQVIFIDAARFTGAYSLKGRYVKQGYDYLVQVRLFKGDDAINKFEVEGSDSSEIAKKIIEKALREIE